MPGQNITEHMLVTLTTHWCMCQGQRFGLLNKPIIIYSISGYLYLLFQGYSIIFQIIADPEGELEHILIGSFEYLHIICIVL